MDQAPARCWWLRGAAATPATPPSRAGAPPRVREVSPGYWTRSVHLITALDLFAFTLLSAGSVTPGVIPTVTGNGSSGSAETLCKH